MFVVVRGSSLLLAVVCGLRIVVVVWSGVLLCLVIRYCLLLFKVVAVRVD